MTHDEAVIAVEAWERELRPLIERVWQLHRAFLSGSRLAELRSLDRQIKRLNRDIKVKLDDQYSVTEAYFIGVLYAETPQRCEIMKHRLWSPDDVVTAIRTFAAQPEEA